MTLAARVSGRGPGLDDASHKGAHRVTTSRSNCERLGVSSLGSSVSTTPVADQGIRAQPHSPPFRFSAASVSVGSPPRGSQTVRCRASDHFQDLQDVLIASPRRSGHRNLARAVE
jgi:hypothetical protein